MSNTKYLMHKVLGLVEAITSRVLNISLCKKYVDSQSYQYGCHFDLYRYFRMDADVAVIIVPSHRSNRGTNLHDIHTIKTWINFDFRYKL
jgi:hypothetical protein